ncbi:DNA recombination protein RmuC [Segatella copri]|uniref:DNA recombination protein RmuC n=1 Tax=Segatella copri TaxID=165179 RepID=UPI003F8CC340
MEIVIGIVIGLAIGFFVGKLMEAKKAGEEKTQLIAKAQVLQANIEQSNLHHAAEVQSLKQSYASEIQGLKAQMENERLFAEKLRAESNQQWAQKLESLKQEMHRMAIEQQKAAAEQLAAKQSALQENNRLQMDELLKPIKEQFADFKKSVEESKTQNEVNKKELQSTFEATMKLFQQEQQQAVTSLKEQTSKIGSDAANLTKALKGDSKMQGDWGEMVLETILENSGLRKDEEFFIQENTKDENGKNFRPDVIVRFPEGRSVVIDSKVSLTAYTDALAAETDEERERLMKSHAQSVRKHIDELAEKDYSKLVEDAIGFVLMFIPNETSYIAAMKQQPDLSRYAYQKKIIIISPSNLLMALQLAYNLWQYDRQNKNVEKIVKTAADLYDKVATFEDTFTGIGDLITRLSGTYDKARKQLYDGTGNVMRRVESLKNLGVTPKKQIKALEE